MSPQGTTTPTGTTAIDPDQERRQASTDDSDAQQIGRGIEANIPGGKEAQRGDQPLHSQTPGRREGVVSNPDSGSPR